MPMTRKNAKRILVVLCILGVYIAVLVMGITEKSRRSLYLESENASPDHVRVSVLVTNFNPVGHELTAQLGFRLAGSIGTDEVTPAADLKLLINNVRGQQEFDFPKGKRINRIEVTFPLNGDSNRYPFDKHETTLRLLMTTPAQKSHAPVSILPEPEREEALESDQLTVGSVALEQRDTVPLSLTLSAAIPGAKFNGNITHSEDTQVTGIKLSMRRANNLISVSILVNTMMTCLAMSVLFIVLRFVGSEDKQVDFVPLSLSIALIFGLPALRNIQPGIPPVGAFCDYVSFIWAELIVAISALIVAWAWLLRSLSESKHP
jgi:hypothetical protein